jgi:hypothetical protein
MRNRTLRWSALVALASLALSSFAADDPCAGFRWDVGHEHALFATPPEPVSLGKDAESAPILIPDKLYQLTLVPQAQVTFAAAPGKKTTVDGASAGLARVRLPVAGNYRISLDRGFWVDLVADRSLITATDFQGRVGCDSPHKIVVYSLPDRQDLLLQLSGAAGSGVRLTITPVPATGR